MNPTSMTQRTPSDARGFARAACFATALLAACAGHADVVFGDCEREARGCPSPIDDEPIPTILPTEPTEPTAVEDLDASETVDAGVDAADVVDVDAADAGPTTDAMEQPCTEDEECLGLVCNTRNGVCGEPGPRGAPCKRNEECRSRRCIFGLARCR